MNKKYILLILILIPFLSFAQDWKVVNFQDDPSDLHARTQQRIDYNKNPCALIKIIIDSNDVKFSGDIVGDVKKENGYWYVYVPEGTRWLTIIENGLPIELDFRESEIDPKQKVTYILELRKAEPNRKKANLTALAYSIVPGIGLMQKGHTIEGVAYLVGDIALIGSGIGLNIYRNNQKRIMNDRNTTLDQYKKAKNNYDAAKTASYICYGAAASVYVLNLVRSYVARPNPGAPLQWAFSADVTPDMGIPGINNLTFNVSLCYTF